MITDKTTPAKSYATIKLGIDAHAKWYYFIVNRGKATATEVLELIERIKEAARKERGIELETEVQILGEDERSF